MEKILHTVNLCLNHSLPLALSCFGYLEKYIKMEQRYRLDFTNITEITRICTSPVQSLTQDWYYPKVVGLAASGENLFQWDGKARTISKLRKGSGGVTFGALETVSDSFDELVHSTVNGNCKENTCPDIGMVDDDACDGKATEVEVSTDYRMPTQQVRDFYLSAGYTLFADTELRLNGLVMRATKSVLSTNRRYGLRNA